MVWSLGFLVLAGTAIGENVTVTHFDNYSIAYRAARQSKRPMLVILNPPKESGKSSILLEDVRRTKERRKLLESYIVVLIDTGTEHGKIIYRLFGSEELPRVSIIGRDQQFQIFGTSEPLYGQLWTEVLDTYHSGEQVTSLAWRAFCPT